MSNFFHSRSSIVQNRIVTEARSVPADAHRIKSMKSAAWWRWSKVETV